MDACAEEENVVDDVIKPCGTLCPQTAANDQLLPPACKLPSSPRVAPA